MVVSVEATVSDKAVMVMLNGIVYECGSIIMIVVARGNVHQSVEQMVSGQEIISIGRIRKAPAVVKPPDHIKYGSNNYILYLSVSQSVRK